jgi:hypothetical protein
MLVALFQVGEVSYQFATTASPTLSSVCDVVEGELAIVRLQSETAPRTV